MKRPILWLLKLLLTLFTIASCQRTEFESEVDNSFTTIPKQGENFQFYTDPNLFFKLKKQSAEDNLQITSVSREGNSFKIIVAYSGGCKKHEVNIVWDGVVKLSNPCKVNLILEHNANGDTCEAMVTDTLDLNIPTYFGDMLEADKTDFTVTTSKDAALHLKDY